MNLFEWAAKWNIPREAINDLIVPQTMIYESIVGALQTEAQILNAVKLEASQKNARLWRNNVGAYSHNGGFIRYGLANESQQINQQIKSADLIGIRKVLITQEMVGTYIGQFLSREVKRANWEYSGDNYEMAQLQWAQLILSFGGDACFATKIGTL